MKRICRLSLIIILSLSGLTTMTYASKLVPPNDPNIQYYGRWDMSDSLHPRYAWPGVYLCVEFSGTSIGIRIADHTNYFNVTIDGKFHSVFHGTKPGEADYILADSLLNSRHTLRLSRRNITLGDSYSFAGFILDDNASLFPPAPRLLRKIEFIGDSFTAAESNEAKEQQLPWEERFPVTNIDKGFAPIIAQYFNAQYTTTCRSGSGMVCDWQGKTEESIPVKFNHTLMDAASPLWDFNQWIPDVVVVSLGLNDHSGLRGKDGKITEEKSALFRKTYHEFLETIRTVYPNVKVVAVAAFPEWILLNVKQVVDDEKKSGKQDIFYTFFDEFPGGYVANGHPTVETHQKMADQIIKSMKSFDLFPGRR